MKTTGVADLEAHLSRYLAAVKAGEEVQVTERGRPTARLIPIAGPEEAEARLLDLERAGLLRRQQLPLERDFLTLERGKDSTAAVRTALEADRGQLRLAAGDEGFQLLPRLI